MNINRHMLLRMFRGGLLACMGPLAFDVCASVYAGRIGMYAPPFLYPIFFVLGVVFVIEDVRKKRGDGSP
jgi:hypothetical protein